MIIILLPVYNEEKSIENLLGRFISSGLEVPIKIVAVDDGSQDRSCEIIESFSNRLPIVLLRHEVNKGVTEVLKTGFAYINNFIEPDDLIITMDSDNTHDPKSINMIFEKFNEGYDIINGSRFCKGGKMIGVPLYRMFFSYACKFILTRLFPIRNILDYSVFYRGYRADLIKGAIRFYGDGLFKTQGFVGMTELLIRLSVFKPNTIEIPLVVRYDYKIGASKMRIFKTIKNYLHMIYILRRDSLHRRAR